MKEQNLKDTQKKDHDKSKTECDPGDQKDKKHKDQGRDEKRPAQAQKPQQKR